MDGGYPENKDPHRQARLSFGPPSCQKVLSCLCGLFVLGRAGVNKNE